MKRIFTILWALVALGIFSLSASAQARFSSNTELVNLGQIEWKHPAVARFVISNPGDQPLVLSQVEPDCDCSSVDWTQTAIAPGSKGEVKVTFDARQLGRFRKSVAVYTNAYPHLVYLHLAGEVVMELTDFTRTHPFRYEDIRLDREVLEFPDIAQGDSTRLSLGVVNLSDSPYEPVLMHLPSYLHAESNPKVLQKGEKGVITLTLRSGQIEELGLTESSVYLSRFKGDKVCTENEIPVRAILLPDFSGLTEADRLRGAVAMLSTDTIDMRQVLAKKAKVKQELLISNIGKSPLHILKLQVFGPAVEIGLKKSLLGPGESTRMRMKINRSTIGDQVHRLRLLMITDDPLHPKREVTLLVK